MADKRLGIVLEVTEKGLAIFDTAGTKLREVDRAAIAASVGLGRTLPAASDQASAGMGRAGAAGAAMGPLIRRGSDLATDGLRKLSLEAAGGVGQLGALGVAAEGIGWKGVEEGLEGVTAKFGNAMAAGTGFKGAMGAVNAELTSLAANPFFSGAILAAAGVQLYKLTDAAIKWKEETDLGAEAQARSETATGRQIDQMAALAKALGTTVGELNEFSTGSGAKGFAALVEQAKNNPEGRIAKAMAELSKATVEAKNATEEHAVAHEKTKAELLAEAEAARALAVATQDAADAAKFSEAIAKSQAATYKALGDQMHQVAEQRHADARQAVEDLKAQSDEAYKFKNNLSPLASGFESGASGGSFELASSGTTVGTAQQGAAESARLKGARSLASGYYAQFLEAFRAEAEGGRDQGKLQGIIDAVSQAGSTLEGAGMTGGFAQSITRGGGGTTLGGSLAEVLKGALRRLADEPQSGRDAGGRFVPEGGGGAPSSAGFGGLEKAAAALEKASAAIVGFTTGGIKLTTEGGRELGRVVSSFQQRGMSETR